MVTAGIRFYNSTGRHRRRAARKNAQSVVISVHTRDRLLEKTRAEQNRTHDDNGDYLRDDDDEMMVNNNNNNSNSNNNNNASCERVVPAHTVVFYK